MLAKNLKITGTFYNRKIKIWSGTLICKNVCLKYSNIGGKN